MRFRDEASPVELSLHSRHAEECLRQRGYRERDLETVMACGTVCAEAIVLTGKDVNRAIEATKREIQNLERLRGTSVIVQGGVVKTVYRPDRRRIRRFLARRRNRSSGGR